MGLPLVFRYAALGREFTAVTSGWGCDKRKVVSWNYVFVGVVVDGTWIVGLSGYNDSRGVEVSVCFSGFKHLGLT